MHEELFENPLFTSDGLTFGTEYKKWKDSGILKVSDILHEKERIILDKMALEAKFNLQIKDMTYNRLIACVSKALKQVSKVSIQQIYNPKAAVSKCLTNIHKVSASDLSKFYTLLNYKPPASQDKWIE